MRTCMCSLAGTSACDHCNIGLNYNEIPIMPINRHDKRTEGWGYLYVPPSDNLFEKWIKKIEEDITKEQKIQETVSFYLQKLIELAEQFKASKNKATEQIKEEKCKKSCSNCQYKRIIKIAKDTNDDNNSIITMQCIYLNANFYLHNQNKNDLDMNCAFWTKDK